MTSSVWTTEQVTKCVSPEQRAPALPLMLRPVMDHVVALAEDREVGVRVVGRVVIPRRGCEDDMGPTGATKDVGPRLGPDPGAPSIAPTANLSVPPAVHRQGGRPSARAVARSSCTNPAPGRSGPSSTVRANRLGRRSGARAGSAWCDAEPDGGSTLQRASPSRL
jgi:hypothetical protein